MSSWKKAVLQLRSSRIIVHKFISRNSQSQMKMAKSFEREYDLEKELGTLVFSQLEEGDVNCVVWDAALVLAKFLEVKAIQQPEWLKGRSVVELGAGLGCVGLVAACHGGNVTLTDQPKALSLLDHNVKQNDELLQTLKASVRTKGIDWCEDTDQDACDILLLADCVYYKDAIQPLIETMLKLTTPTTEILMSQEDRSYSEIQKSTWEEFCTQAGKHFTTSKVPIQEQHDKFNSPDIRLIRLSKKEINNGTNLTANGL